MEALLAIGLTGNVVQFVQFTGKLISESNEIRKSGSPSSLPELKTLSHNLITQTSIITTRLKACSATLAPEEQYLLDIAADCEEAGSRFVAYLDTVVRKTASSNVFQNLQASLKFHWVHHKIEDFIGSLERLRSALTLATVLALRTSSTSNNEEILAHLREIQADERTSTQENSQLANSIRLLSESIQEQAHQHTEALKKYIQECIADIARERRHILQNRERDILRWLNFRQMPWRHDDIHHAYRQTFKWIFKEPPLENGWDNFRAHLSTPDRTAPYFIVGKAGSGKSTLMKFVCGHPDTKQALKEWADGEEVTMLSFYFWNLGTTLQKSDTGMLRVLLCDLLERHPELIPVALPRLFQHWVPSDETIEPTRSELVRALHALLEKSTSFLKLCIFVDGIDEVEGDHKGVSQFLLSLVRPNVKVVVSSRPINACLYTFQGCPSLRLQDLTGPDMELFVQGELCSHPMMVGLARQFPREAESLIHAVRTKAEGVFLWVELVVKLLVHGLEDGDGITELQQKLKALPSDLRALYRRMIGRQQPEHQIQAAQMFQVFCAWNALTTHEPLSALTLSFAIQSSSDVFNLPIRPLETEALIWLFANIDARVRSRCCGLLEVNRKWPRLTSEMNPSVFYCRSKEEMQGSVVSYLHRTVAEFLASADVWDDICAMTKKLGFEPTLSLASAYLAMVKTATKFFNPSLLSHLLLAAKFCRNAPHINTTILRCYLSCIDRTMERHWYKTSGGKGNSPVDQYTHWSSRLFAVGCLGNMNVRAHIQRLANIDTFAARNALVLHLKAIRNQVTYDSRCAVVLNALESWREFGSPYETAAPLQDRSPFDAAVPLHERSETLSYLLRNFAGPGDEILGIAIWEYAIAIAKALRPADAAELLRVLLSAAPVIADRPDCRSLIDELRKYDIEEVVALTRILENDERSSPAASYSLHDARPRPRDGLGFASATGPARNRDLWTSIPTAQPMATRNCARIFVCSQSVAHFEPLPPPPPPASFGAGQLQPRMEPTRPNAFQMALGDLQQIFPYGIPSVSRAPSAWTYSGTSSSNPPSAAWREWTRNFHSAGA
ncbi:hypothetical protein BU26DRAFT_269347 [Trematosphaeria pertusa]|uniref:NACHT domain-containing protein n=1 Tax=Trematosphaeria pertusa TaxID=390896 RepID=A0A6A6IL02_9PLEO|nr:uncharacterized protein BU26DRAFT_269347 [Trematosphaeria pertusa]KAF2250748.1 hypothetical protein BU26DRAFT_269347 [Trematosphaeria pertusa]